MEIVIKIPNFEWLKNEEDFKTAVKEYEQGTRFDKEIRNALINGTPLPKGHGRLVDADAYRKELLLEIPNLDYDGSLEPYEEGIYSAIMSLDDAPTIIEGSDSEC